jgi:hypothetical protein
MSPFRAISNSNSVQYRYDGLFLIKGFDIVDGKNEYVRSQKVETYQFYLERAAKGLTNMDNGLCDFGFVLRCVEEESVDWNGVVALNSTESCEYPSNVDTTFVK